MPIHNLTTETAKAFMRLGNIRKGDRGGKNNAPRDLDHFRITYLPGKHAEELQRTIESVYGKTPPEINIRFPYHTIGEVWDANYECYKQGGLIAKAYTDADGAHWNFYRDPDSAQVLVRDGSPVGIDGQRFFEKPFTVDAPIYKNAKGEGVFMKPVGRLQVVIPEVAHLAVGYFLFQPGSPRDMRNITAELGAYDAIAKQYGKTIAGMPFKLIRRKEEVTKNINGTLSKGDSWVVHLEVSGEFGRMAMEVIERLALPEIIDVEPEYPELSDDFPFEEEQESAAPPDLPAPVPADEMINPLDTKALEFAAKEWNLTTTRAHREISIKIRDGVMTNPMSKKTFKSIVAGSPQ